MPLAPSTVSPSRVTHLAPPVSPADRLARFFASLRRIAERLRACAQPARVAVPAAGPETRFHCRWRAKAGGSARQLQSDRWNIGRWVLVLGLVSACASSQAVPLTAQKYEENARSAFMAAMAEFEDKDWETATTMFEQVKREYAYSHYARMAELRLADIAFKQEKFAEAVTSYRSFVHDHPNDSSVAYARFQVTKALYEQTGDSLLLPPQEERELASAADAYTAMKSFLSDFPRYEGSPEVEYMLSIVTGLLVRHELYVARFYLQKGRFEAAVVRCQYALDRLDGSGLEPEALVLLGETYLKLKRREDARNTFIAVLTKYPDSAFTVPAKNFLAQIEQ
jgi:outer membrane protein assembly factor BamD